MKQDEKETDTDSALENKDSSSGLAVLPHSAVDDWRGCNNL